MWSSFWKFHFYNTLKKGINKPDSVSVKQTEPSFLNQLYSKFLSRLTRKLRIGDSLLLNLAPDEVYIAVSVTENAVGSYPALSPLPQNAAVYFLLHCL